MRISRGGVVRDMTPEEEAELLAHHAREEATALPKAVSRRRLLLDAEMDCLVLIALRTGDDLTAIRAAYAEAIAAIDKATTPDEVAAIAIARPKE